MRRQWCIGTRDLALEAGFCVDGRSRGTLSGTLAMTVSRRPVSRPRRPADAAGRGLLDGLDEAARKAGQGGRELVVVIEHHWPPGVQRFERDPVVARKRMRHGRAEDALDVALANLGLNVVAAYDDREPLLAVTLPQRRRQPRRCTDGREFLVGDDHDARRRLERVDHEV